MSRIQSVSLRATLLEIDFKEVTPHDIGLMSISVEAIADADFLSKLTEFIKNETKV